MFVFPQCSVFEMWSQPEPYIEGRNGGAMERQEGNQGNHMNQDPSEFDCSSKAVFRHFH